MRFRRQIYKLVFYFCPILIGMMSSSCTSIASTNDIGDHLIPQPVKLDSTIRYGRLPNGFTYFIKSVPDSQSKLFLRFYNKAGYNQHDPDQLNIAHAVEHLAYKATQNFPKGLANSERIDKLGMEMFDYIAASSGNRSTQFYFDAPMDNDEALEAGLLFFKDIATGLKLTETDINSVRGELRQEFLEGGEDLNEMIRLKLQSKIFPCRQDYSDFLDYHKNFSSEVVRRFYKDWYRPDLMAVSAVGKIEDIESLERCIVNIFSEIKPAKNPRERRNCDSLYYSRSPQFFIVERPKNNLELIPDKMVNLQMIFRDQVTNESLHSLKGMEQLVLMKLLMQIINKRLKKLNKGYNSFYAGVRDIYQYEELPVALMVDVKFDNTNEKHAVQKIMSVLNQLQKFGVTDKEWIELRQNHLQYFETSNDKDPAYWINQFKRYFDNAEVFAVNKNIHLRNWLYSMQPLEFNKFMNEFLLKEPEDIAFIVPKDHKTVDLTENKVRKWINETKRNPVMPFKEERIPKELMTQQEVASLKEVEVLDQGIGISGAKEFLLQNGLKLVIKPFEVKGGHEGEKLKIHGFALKGANCFSKKDFFSVINAPFIIKYSGFNGMNKFEINDFLVNRDLLPGIATPYIDINEIGIQGTVSSKDLEILLQLIYLQFTRPNKDKVAFEDWKTEKYKAYKNHSDADFQNTIKKITGDSSVVEEVLGYKSLQIGTDQFLEIDKINLDVAYDLYQKLFSSAKDFTFIVTGDFELELVLPILMKYLGNLPNLPSSKNCFSVPQVESEWQTSPSFHVIPAPEEYALKNIKYGIAFHKPAANPVNWQEQIKVEALGKISTLKAWELRFEKGYSLYSVGVEGRLNRKMMRYEISSNFACVPEEFPFIRQEMHQIISDLKSGKINEGLFKEGMERLYFLYDTENREGEFKKLHQDLYYHYRYNQPWVNPDVLGRYVKSLTIEDIVETANKYFKEEYMYEFVMKEKELK